MKTHSYQIYALQNSKIVYIDDVVSGKKCNCICPGCQEPLIARKGNMRIHHFAHQSSACEYAYESSLHLAAKDILSKSNTFTLPPTYTLFPHVRKDDNSFYDAKAINIDRVELEKQFESIIPDIVIYSGGKKLFVEIYVTHKVDEDKKKKIEQMGISAVEIDLSSIEGTITKEQLTEILIDDRPEKKWIFNSWSETCLQRLYSYAVERNITIRRVARHVDDCPIHIRDFHGKAYANFIDDCLGCEYFWEEKDGNILCSGATLVSTMQDLELTYDERKANKEKEKSLYKEQYSEPAQYDGQVSHQTIYKPVKIKETTEVENPSFLATDFDKQVPVIDNNGWRWMLCTSCGAILRVDNMQTLGTPGNINKGICRMCYKNKKYD